MENMPSTRSMIITLYGDYIRHYGNEIWIGSLIELLAAFGYNEQSVRAAISRMSKQNWLESRKEGNKSFYSLTKFGKRRTEEAAGRIYQVEPGKWDGKWRIFFYKIPEERRKVRDQLRNELIWSGFAPLSNSAWISPNDLKEQVYTIVKKYDIADNVNFFVSENIGTKSNTQIVSEYWDIEEINRTYEKFISLFKDGYQNDESKIRSGKLSNQKCFVRRALLVHEYRKSLFVDPGLPKELLPNKWKKEEAVHLFQKYYRILEQPANEYFEEVFSKGYGKITKNSNIM
jgi:phenylacetic acid degradation operon negative regulatory protein